MNALDPATLDPGIRRTVLWLRERGYHTTDSGDGVTKIGVMECALDVAHVHMRCEARDMIVVARNLAAELAHVGVEPVPGMVQATYDPCSPLLGIVSLYLVDDETLDAARLRSA